MSVRDEKFKTVIYNLMNGAYNANIKIKGFVRFETGEGIEKKEEDFAAEVAAQMNA